MHILNRFGNKEEAPEEQKQKRQSCQYQKSMPGISTINIGYSQWRTVG